jgi:Domain of unknown function (DUF4174)
MQIFKIFSFLTMSSGMHLLRRSLAYLVTVICTSGLAAWAPAAAKSASGHRHSLLVFAPEMLSKTLSKQLAAISGQQGGLDERTITVVYVIGRSMTAPPGSNFLTPAVKLRAHYKVGLDEFRTILADESGDIELISDVPITAEQLFQTTDAIPVADESLRGPQ